MAVALGTEMAVTEALELQDGLERQLGRGLTAVIVNGLLPRRFSRRDGADRTARRRSAPPAPGRARPDGGSTRTPRRGRRAAAATRRGAVRSIALAYQHNQLARLRRRELRGRRRAVRLG